MATGVTTNYLASIMAIKSFDHDPGATSAKEVSGDGGTTKNYVAMRDFETFGLLVFNSVSTSASGPTLVELVAATDSSGTNITVVLSSGTVASVTVGDNIFLEVSAAQIKEVGDAAGLTFTHVSGRITCSNSGDECVATFIRAKPKYPQSALTLNNIT